MKSIHFLPFILIIFVNCKTLITKQQWEGNKIKQFKAEVEVEMDAIYVKELSPVKKFIILKIILNKALNVTFVLFAIVIILLFYEIAEKIWQRKR